MTRYPLAAAFALAGTILTVAGAWANRYHSRRFKQHTSRLRRLEKTGRGDEIADEITAFYEDRWVEVAVHLMALGPMLATTCFAGVVVALVWL